MDMLKKTVGIIISLVVMVAGAYAVYRLMTLKEQSPLDRNMMTNQRLKPTLLPTKNQAEPVKGKYNAVVVLWDGDQGLLTIKTTDNLQKTVLVEPGKPVIKVRVNTPNSPVNEVPVFAKQSPHWQAAFCPGDTIEVNTETGNTESAYIHNTGDRTCGLLIKG